MFACIFIPDFPAQAIIRFDPELRDRPVAVLSGRPPLEKVMALNERARQLGVDAGVTKSQLEAWENLALRARSESQEMSAHAALLDCAQSFSPRALRQTHRHAAVPAIRQKFRWPAFGARPAGAYSRSQ